MLCELYCIALYCIALHCVALRCVSFRCVALRCVTLRCVALRCVALRCVALRCVALRYVALRCVALHCINRLVCCMKSSGETKRFDLSSVEYVDFASDDLDVGRRTWRMLTIISNWPLLSATVRRGGGGRHVSNRIVVMRTRPSTSVYSYKCRQRLSSTSANLHVLPLRRTEPLRCTADWVKASATGRTDGQAAK